MIVSFTVFGSPQGKARPRFKKRGNFVQTYTPTSTQKYEALIANEYKKQCHYKFEETLPLYVTLTIYFDIPKSASKKKAEQMRKSEIRPIKKPDVDNVVKVFLDSLNGIAYRDDVQVVECFVAKYYSDTPRVEITIQNIEKED